MTFATIYRINYLMKPFSGILLRILPLILFSLAVYFVATRFAEKQNTVSPPEAQLALRALGKPALDFSLPSATDKVGTPFQFASLRGNAVILNFWATWCAPCVREIPGLLAVARKYKNDGLRIVAVSVDKDWDAIERFFTRYPQLASAKTEFVLLLDRDLKVATEYGATQFPESFLINRDFVIDMRLSGEQLWQDPRLTLYYDRILRK